MPYSLRALWVGSQFNVVVLLDGTGGTSGWECSRSVLPELVTIMIHGALPIQMSVAEMNAVKELRKLEVTVQPSEACILYVEN